ncbi:hypothetical protein Vadar_010544 [Vaccinium darrowii]|uniref:Uncharacterized protein n=1 Tax=Vaccinium darrowii TaxID=229202 RepID=A0ACB7YUU0_9ERIC|nr:hypothetical protein Vadar_010544 [Vaccinium darrowii]
MPLIRYQIKPKDAYFLSPPLPSSLSSYQKISNPSPTSPSGGKISQTGLLVIIILAALFFISGLLHLLVRFLSKHRSSSTISQSNRYPGEISGSGTFRRQLQQLFHLHDSGLDQVLIDALPVFFYKEIKGLKEPFDCAVCLCEFSEQDKLRLLPLCSHAFHIACIDTWLLSNSTCPLCRGTLFTSGFSWENPVFEFDDSREEDGIPGHGPAGVFPVRLGKFRSTNHVDEGGGGERKEEGETSSSNVDARRCYSLGSFQYVVANSNLQVALCPNRDCGGGGGVKRRGGPNGKLSVDGDIEMKRIRSKGESFSVSKIWQWSKKDKLPSSFDTHMVSPPVNIVSLEWNDRTQATSR